MKRHRGVAILLTVLGLASPGTAQRAEPPSRDEIEGLSLGVTRAEAFRRLSDTGFRLSPAANAPGSLWVAAKIARRWPDDAGGIDADDYLSLSFCTDRLHRISRHTRFESRDAQTVDDLRHGDGISNGYQFRHRRDESDRWWRDVRVWDDRICSR